MKPERLLEVAASLSRQRKDGRVYHLGAVGLRADGAVVTAYNGNQMEPDPLHHAERRVARKLDRGAVVYVARTLANGTWALASPCVHCRKALRHCSKVFYSIGPGEFGVWSP